MMRQQTSNKSKIDVLEGLIKHMRNLELGADEPDDALGEGLEAVGEDMTSEDDRDIADDVESDEPAIDIEIEAEGPVEELAEEEDAEEELTPFQKKMGDFFNDRDRPKLGSAMSFMVESKKRPSDGQRMDTSSRRKDGMNSHMASDLEMQKKRAKFRKG